MKKAWEIVLASVWLDEHKSIDDVALMLKEDVDQLRVALLKGGGGNSEMVTKILLARSPPHLHAIVVEYFKATHQSLTRAIKDCFSGTLARLLLHAVESGKKDGDAPGICKYCIHHSMLLY